MSISVGDLPPEYQKQAFQKLMARREKKAVSPSAAGGERKYRNQPAERMTAAGNILRFDSQKEARRYDELSALERAGKIRDLRMQVDFTLQEAYTDTEGRRVRAIRYRADFVYHQKRPCGWRPDNPAETVWSWLLVVEDVKSRATRTKEYALKRKLMKERFHIDIQEV